MHRTVVATALVAFLGFTAPSSLLAPLWLLLSSFWSDSPATDLGCGWDPYGRCTPTEGAQSDEGLGWDPDGGSLSVQNAQGKVGCTFDPNGRCMPNQNVQAKAGCIFDPNGHCLPTS